MDIFSYSAMEGCAKEKEFDTEKDFKSSMPDLINVTLEVHYEGIP